MLRYFHLNEFYEIEKHCLVQLLYKDIDVCSLTVIYKQKILENIQQVTQDFLHINSVITEFSITWGYWG